jgi:hypothetical protein
VKGAMMNRCKIVINSEKRDAISGALTDFFFCSELKKLFVQYPNVPIIVGKYAGGPQIVLAYSPV